MAGDLRCSCGAPSVKDGLCAVCLRISDNLTKRAAGDLRSQLIKALSKDCQSKPCVQKVHEADADRVLPVIEDYAVKRAEAMRERCAKAIEATESGSPALRQWAARVVRAAPAED